MCCKAYQSSAGVSGFTFALCPPAYFSLPSFLVQRAVGKCFLSNCRGSRIQSKTTIKSESQHFQGDCLCIRNRLEDRKRSQKEAVSWTQTLGCNYLATIVASFWLYMPQQGFTSSDLDGFIYVSVVVLLRWSAELHHNCSLTSSPQEEEGKKKVYWKGKKNNSRAEIKMI